MRFVIQRVQKAKVSVDNNIIGEIDQGLLVFVGICQTDTIDIADKMIRKLIGLRIFEDANGKTNLNLKSIDGNMLIISQFTLYADCKKGNRPSFIHAANPELAKNLYEYIIEKCKDEIPCVESGEFGADMKVSLMNDGPFTITLDSAEIC